MSSFSDQFFSETGYRPYAMTCHVVAATDEYIKYLESRLEKAESPATVRGVPPANTEMVEICPHRDTWTVIGSNGNLQYTIPACVKGGQT
jgi:hypothetical protein